MNPKDPTQPNYVEIGSDPVNEMEGFSIESTPASNTPVTPPTPVPENPNIVQLGADGVLSFGALRSPNFSTGNSGWRITANGDVEFGDGYFRGDITGASGTFSGTITASAGTIGGFSVGADYLRDAADTMGLASTVTGGDDVRFWAGAPFASRATAPFRGTEAGAVTASNFSFTGGSVGSAVVVALGALNIAARGWTQTCVFSTLTASLVSWEAGTFTSADGTAYSISAGSTGTMSAKTYIYLDVAVSTTAYQTTTTPTTANGAGKVLIATAENGTNEATFSVLGGAGGQKIDAESLVANSITANQLSTSLLYAGSVEIDTLGNIRSGQTDYNTGDGFWIGNHVGTPKLSIGSTSTVYSTIAFDAVSNGGEDSTVSSSTHSHTCTGSNLTLFVLISSTDSSLTDRTVSSVTYAGVACTKIISNDNSDIRHSEIWALQNPTTGSNSIVVTMGGTCTTLTVCGISLTGTGSIIASSGVNQAGSTTSASVNLTTLVDGSWLVGVLHTSNGGSSYSEGAGQTNRFTQAGSNSDVQASTKSVASAGDTTMSWTWTTNAWRAMSAVVVQPKETITTDSNYLLWDGTNLSATGIVNYEKSFSTLREFDGSTTPVPLYINAGGYLQVAEADVTEKAHFIGFSPATVTDVYPDLLSSGQSTSASFSATGNAGTNRVLILQVGASRGGASDVIMPTSATWGATSLTSLDSDIVAGDFGQRIFYAVVGTSGSNQAQTLTITGGTYDSLGVTYSFWDNVNQSDPIGASLQSTGTSTSASSTITPERATSIVLGLLTRGNTGGTSWNDGLVDYQSIAGGDIDTNAASVAWHELSANAFDASITSNSWILMALELNTNTAGSARVRMSGVQDGFSGLTIGSAYYVSNTEGVLSTTPGTTTVLVGKAVSATELLIVHNAQ